MEPVKWNQRETTRAIRPTITIGRSDVSNARADRRNTWRAVPAVWSQNATLEVALAGRLAVHPMSGSAPRLDCRLPGAGSAPCPHQPGGLMGAGNSASATVFV